MVKIVTDKSHAYNKEHFTVIFSHVELMANQNKVRVEIGMSCIFDEYEKLLRDMHTCACVCVCVCVCVCAGVCVYLCVLLSPL